MTEVPGTEWTQISTSAQALRRAPRLRAKPDWRRMSGVGAPRLHAFPARTRGLRRELPRATPAPKGARWVALAELAGEALPSVMRKVLSAALEPD